MDVYVRMGRPGEPDRLSVEIQRETIRSHLESRDAAGDTFDVADWVSAWQADEPA